ncbi:MAG: hypothetical protein R2867_25825 [Caldilineaceae bacterium]
MTARGSLQRAELDTTPPAFPPGTRRPTYDMGEQRAHDEARQRGVVDAVEQIIESGALTKFNVDSFRIRRLVTYLYNIDESLFRLGENHHDHERVEEPNLALEATYQAAYGKRDAIAQHIEKYSHIGIFTFIHNYHLNWVAPEHGRDKTVVQQAMLDILFPLTPHEAIWKEYCAFTPEKLPEPIWQFSRQRYLWAKDQWPNLSGRITTIWTLQDFGLIPRELDIKTVISVADGRQYKLVKIHTSSTGDTMEVEKETLDTGLDPDLDAQVISAPE